MLIISQYKVTKVYLSWYFLFLFNISWRVRDLTSQWKAECLVTTFLVPITTISLINPSSSFCSEDKCPVACLGEAELSVVTSPSTCQPCSLHIHIHTYQTFIQLMKVIKRLAFWISADLVL